jgi:hypothetical protein
MTSLSSTPANYQNVAGVLEFRGYRWKSVAMKKVHWQSRNLSFDEEWKKFITCVTMITGITSEAYDATTSQWNCFERVISPIGGHDNERSFSIALFEALRQSLDDFVDPRLSAANRIALKNRPIRFGTGVYRTKLGYHEGYVLSEDSENDHCCFVTSTDTEECVFDDMTAVVELQLEGTSCQSFDVKAGEIVKPDFIKLHGPMGQAMVYSMDVWHCLARRGVSVANLPVVVLAGKGKSEPQKRKAEEFAESQNRRRICGLGAHISIPAFCGNTFFYSVDEIVDFGDVMVTSKDKAAVSMNSSDGRAIAMYIRAMRIGLARAIQVVKLKSIPAAPPVSLCCRQLLRRSKEAQLVACPIPHANQIQGPGMAVHLGEIFALAKARKMDFAGLLDFHWFVDSADDAILTDNCLVKVNCVPVHNALIRPLLCEEALEELHSACGKNSKLKEEISKVFLGFSATDNFTLVIVMKDLRNDNFDILDHEKLRKDKKLPELWFAFCKLVKSLLLPMAAANVIHADIRSTSNVTYNILYCDVPTETAEINHVGGLNARNLIELRLIDFDSLLLYSSVKDANLASQDHAIYWGNLNKAVGIDNDGNEAEGALGEEKGSDMAIDEDEEKEHKFVAEDEDNTKISVAEKNFMESSKWKDIYTDFSAAGEFEEGMTDLETNEFEVTDEKEYWGSAHKYLFWQVLWIAYTWHPYAATSTTAGAFVLHFLSDHDEFSTFRQWLGAESVEILRDSSFGEITAQTIEQAVEVLSQAPW